MPYKRRLRLLWVAVEHPEWAEQACDAAQPAGAERIEQRSAGAAPSPEAIAWADLILTLDASARAALPELPPRVQARHMDLAAAVDAAARRAMIEARVAGVLGGLRLLDRLYDEAEPPDGCA